MNRKAQQIIEYILLIASVMVVFLAISGPTGMIRWRVEDSINRTLDLIKEGNRLSSRTYRWSAPDCSCAGKRSCVYPGVSEEVVQCKYQCLDKDGKTVENSFCSEQFGYKPSSSHGCGSEPCCGNKSLEDGNEGRPNYSEQCDASAGFTETCESYYGQKPYGWSGNVSCKDCEIVDDCAVNPSPEPEAVCGDGEVGGTEQCDIMAHGRVVFGSEVPSSCTDYALNGQSFDGGLLGCDSCEVDTGDCYICDPWGNEECGTGDKTDASPGSAADCLKNGTEFVTRACTRGNGTMFEERKCQPNPACGNQCLNKDDNATRCPNSAQYSYSGEWTYVDGEGDCGLDACTAYCIGDLVVKNNVCDCPKENFLFDSKTETCICPDGFIVVDEQCISSPGKWVNFPKSRQNKRPSEIADACKDLCNDESMDSGTSPEGMMCASGENRPPSGEGIIYGGTWGGVLGPEDYSGENFPNGRKMVLAQCYKVYPYCCYEEVQKQDENTSDLLVACYCVPKE